MSIELASVPAIDVRAICQLAEGDELGKQFIVEIIEVFLGDLSECVRAIRRHMCSNNCAGIEATAHAVRGSCGHFGAARLRELSGAVEERARRGQIDGLQAAIDSMVAETERVRDALEAFRAEIEQS